MIYFLDKWISCAWAGEKWVGQILLWHLTARPLANVMIKEIIKWKRLICSSKIKESKSLGFLVLMKIIIFKSSRSVGFYMERLESEERNREDKQRNKMWRQNLTDGSVRFGFAKKNNNGGFRKGPIGHDINNHACRKAHK